VTLPPLELRRARELLARMPGLHALVVGDVMVDRFIVGAVSRISPEAPVPVVQFRHEYARAGGAANVAHNLATLGARVTLIGVVGRDEAATRLRETLDASGIGGEGLVVDAGRPTVEKVRVVTDRNQQVARIDYEHDDEVSDAVERQIIERIAALGGGARVLLVSDYLKGTITARVMQPLLAMKSDGVPLLIDPKIPHLDCYAGASLVTPNHHEAEIATNRRIRTDEDARVAAIDFRRRARSDAALITRGEHGMWLSSDGAEGAIPSVAREVSDVTGAGDTVAATLALALAAGASFAEASVLANHAAGVAVAKFGPAAVTPEEIVASLPAPQSQP
jgi:rfaE bifunctional protein kinase chain/domain